MKDKEPDLENSQRIFEFISANPGVHLRKMSRSLGIHLSTLRYHVTLLEKKELIVGKKADNLRVYFAADRSTTVDKNITSILQQKRFRDLLLLLLVRPGLTHSEVCRGLSVKPPTLSKYIDILEKRGVVRSMKDGRGRKYYVNDEKRVMELLLNYKRSFWDPFVDNVLDIYFD